MISSILSRLVILVFGILYPVYASYKAVDSKDVKQYVKWMMYWIVFGLFTCAETITDVFLCWLPFYYEIKIILVVWLLSPATKGSSFLYRKFVHPLLRSKEQEIDEYISKAKEQSYKQMLDLGSKGVNVLMQTALKSGGGLVNQIKKSYSLSDLSECHTRQDGRDETDVLVESVHLRNKRQTPRGTSTSMYFSEIDIRSESLVSVQSAEDISSGYSSGEVLLNQQPLKLQAREGLVRSGSISNKTKPTKIVRSSIVPRRTTQSSEDDLSLKTDTSSDSSSDGEFLDTVDSNNEITGNAFDSNCENALMITIDSQTKIDDDLSKTNNPPIDVNSQTLESNEIEVRQLDVVADKKECRAGKYHKKAAPEPPPKDDTPPTIKATLVLKPGILKPVGASSESEVFCHSPKMKRKKSPSPSPKLFNRKLFSKSPNPLKKFESPMSKLLMLQKKIFKSDAHLDVQKRFSWHEGDSSLDVEIKEQSKSNISIPIALEKEKSVDNPSTSADC